MSVGRESRLRVVVDNAPPDEERAQLQAFAEAVDDEAHWQRLLASAVDDATRAELERVVGPMLPFRAPRCHTPSCESDLPPIWQPVLVVRKRPGDTPSWAPIEIRVCQACKDAMRIADVLTDAIWMQLVTQCVQSAEPVPTRQLTELMFDRLQ